MARANFHYKHSMGLQSNESLDGIVGVTKRLVEIQEGLNIIPELSSKVFIPYSNGFMYEVFLKGSDENVKEAIELIFENKPFPEYVYGSNNVYDKIEEFDVELVRNWRTMWMGRQINGI